MSPDFINALFEFGGMVVTIWNIKTVIKHKEVKGVHPIPMLFFMAWGVWNLFYYPHLDQWYSFAAGVGLVICALVYFALLIYYKRKT